MTIDAIRLYAHRNLRPRSVPLGTYPGVDEYFSIVDGELPSWWNSAWEERVGDEVLGVLENMPGSSRNALVLGRTVISVLEGSDLSTVRYIDVIDFGRLSKQPVSESIELSVRGMSTVVSIPVVGQSGSIFCVLRFLMSAVHEARQSEGEKDRSS